MRALTQRLFTVVARGCPAAWSALAARASGLAIAIEIGDERIGVVIDGEGPRLADTEPTVRVRSDVAALQALFLGERDVLDLLDEERLEVYGPARELATLDDVVQVLVAGAARAPGADALLDELLQL